MTPSEWSGHEFGKERQRTTKAGRAAVRQAGGRRGTLHAGERIGPDLDGATSARDLEALRTTVQESPSMSCLAWSFRLDGRRDDRHLTSTRLPLHADLADANITPSP